MQEMLLLLLLLLHVNQVLIVCYLMWGQLRLRIRLRCHSGRNIVIIIILADDTTARRHLLTQVVVIGHIRLYVDRHLWWHSSVAVGEGGWIGIVVTVPGSTTSIGQGVVGILWLLLLLHSG